MDKLFRPKFAARFHEHGCESIVQSSVLFLAEQSALAWRGDLQERIGEDPIAPAILHGIGGGVRPPLADILARKVKCGNRLPHHHRTIAAIREMSTVRKRATRRIAPDIEKCVPVKQHLRIRPTQFDLPCSFRNPCLLASLFANSLAFLDGDEVEMFRKEIQLFRRKIIRRFPDMGIHRHALPTECRNRLTTGVDVPRHEQINGESKKMFHQANGVNSVSRAKVRFPGCSLAQDIVGKVGGGFGTET